MKSLTSPLAQPTDLAPLTAGEGGCGDEDKTPRRNSSSFKTPKRVAPGRDAPRKCTHENNPRNRNKLTTDLPFLPREVSGPLTCFHGHIPLTRTSQHFFSKPSQIVVSSPTLTITLAHCAFEVLTQARSCRPKMNDPKNKVSSESLRIFFAHAGFPPEYMLRAIHLFHLFLGPETSVFLQTLPYGVVNGVHYLTSFRVANFFSFFVIPDHPVRCLDSGPNNMTPIPTLGYPHSTVFFLKKCRFHEISTNLKKSP